MGFPKISFQIIKSNKCPLYEYGDIISLTGIAITMQNTGNNSCVVTTVVHAPNDKETCKILSADLTRIIIEYERADKVPACIINCSGCTGSIRIEHNPLIFLDKEVIILPENEELEKIIPEVAKFSFFKNIDRNNLPDVLRFFELKHCNKDAIIIRKGDPGDNFFIIVSGKVEILNDVGITISTLSKGEVFGEMSLICNEEVGATVQASESTELLCISQKFFKKILRKYPSFQLYFTKLMAKRLTMSNKIRSEDYASGMIGKLEEIPPEALFQTLNINQKTGILTITQLAGGTARFSLRHGALIKASYKGKTGEAAFYDILKEKEGRFKFTPGLPPEDFEVKEIGYFMKLLMEGLRRIDEQKVVKTN